MDTVDQEEVQMDTTSIVCLHIMLVSVPKDWNASRSPRICTANAYTRVRYTFQLIDMLLHICEEEIIRHGMYLSLCTLFFFARCRRAM